MLGLYEAAHLRVQEEDILDEALAFTTAHLESLVEDLDYPLAAQVTQALYSPLGKVWRDWRQGLTYLSTKMKLHTVKVYWNLPS